MIRLCTAVLGAACLLLGCGADAPPPSSSKKPKTASGFPSLSDMLVVEIVHSEIHACAFHSRSQVCWDEFHWNVALNRRASPDWPTAIAFIKSEAARVANKKQPKLSDLKTEVVAETGAPYGAMQKALAACATAGIVNVRVTEFKTKLVDWTASPIGVGIGGTEPELVLLIGKQEPSEKVAFRWVDAAGLKEAIDAAAGDRKDLPVVLKPLDSTIWGEVLGIRDSCRKWGLSQVEFAAPFKVRDLWK